MIIKSKLDNSCLNGFDTNFNPNAFFIDRNGFLKYYFPEMAKSAGNLVEHYAKAYNINQRLIIATLQKEQGLIEMTTPPDKRILDRACGVGCLDDGTVLIKFLGFENQIAGACSTYRAWFNYWKVGMSCEVFDIPEKVATPTNAITYSFMRYTPRIAALELIDNVYSGYFIKGV